jgi:hypothetical protein
MLVFDLYGSKDDRGNQAAREKVIPKTLPECHPFALRRDLLLRAYINGEPGEVGASDWEGIGQKSLI